MMINKHGLMAFAGMLLFAGILLSSCTEQETKEKNVYSDDEPEEKPSDESLEYKLDQTKKIFIMLPSPIETASLLKKAGASYDKKILNPIENVSKYETIKSQALNLGIYSSDLSYTSIFDQTQESMFYVSCAKKMADGLGITAAFDQKTMERIEMNINKRDSMLAIITDAFWITDNHLKKNERNNISALIMTGGWIEGLYIATKVLNPQAPNPDIIKRIAEQKYSLDHLVALIQSYEKDDMLEGITEDLTALKDIYDQLEVVQMVGENRTNPETGVTSIGAKQELKINDEQLSAIIKKIEIIRNKYIA